MIAWDEKQTRKAIRECEGSAEAHRIFARLADEAAEQYRRQLAQNWPEDEDDRCRDSTSNTSTQDRLNAAGRALGAIEETAQAMSDGTLISEVDAFDDAITAARAAISVAQQLTAP